VSRRQQPGKYEVIATIPHASCIPGILRNVKVEGVRLGRSRARRAVRGTPAIVRVSVAQRLESGRYLLNVRGSLLAITASGGLKPAEPEPGAGR